MFLRRIQKPALAIGLVAAVFGWSVQVENWFDFLLYLLVVLALGFAVFPFFRKRARGALSMQLFVTALIVKIAASAGRHWTIFSLYGGSGDAARYDNEGALIADALSVGNVSVLEGWRLGTPAVEYLTGFVYWLLPQSREGIFLLFSLLALFGSLFYLLAFRAAFPDKKPEAYAAVVLLLPSILFWPASLGKDALTYLGFGIVAYGIALQWVRHSPQGMVWILAGLAPVVMVRPHSAGIFTVAAGVAFLWSIIGGGRNLGMRVVSGLALGILGYFIIQTNSEFLFGADVDQVSQSEIVQFYEQRRQSTMTGGSAVEMPSGLAALIGGAGAEMPSELLVLAPLYIAVTVLFRPFPWEADSIALAISSAESFFFLWFFIRHRKEFWVNLKLSRKNMLFAFSLFFTLGLMALQSGMSNMGIISRQRVQFLPYLFMLFM